MVKLWELDRFYQATLNCDVPKNAELLREVQTSNPNSFINVF